MIRERDHSNAVTFVLLGVILGSISHAVMTTPRGKQVMHDATKLCDDFVNLCDSILDTNVSYESTLDGVSAFLNNSLEKLDRLGGMSVSSDNNIPIHAISADRVIEKAATRIEVKNQTVAIEAPVANPSHVESQKMTDADVALLHRISRGLR